MKCFVYGFWFNFSYFDLSFSFYNIGPDIIFWIKSNHSHVFKKMITYYVLIKPSQKNHADSNWITWLSFRKRTFDFQQRALFLGSNQKLQSPECLSFTIDYLIDDLVLIILAPQKDFSHIGGQFHPANFSILQHFFAYWGPIWFCQFWHPATILRMLL